MSDPQAPLLPDGIVVVVKRECETCQMVVPVLGELAEAVELHVYTQDDPDFPDDPPAIPDSDLAVSWFHDIETVPTVIRCADGVEVERTVGWSRQAWEELTGVDGLGADLPPMRPGCGSMSVDPDLVDELRVRFGRSALSSRRVEVAAAEDEFEMMFARGWTDGLPVVPPTEERVMAMLEGTSRAPSRHRRHGAARPRRDHRREGRDRRGHGRLQTRVPAVGAHRRRGGLQRRVQHARSPGHHDAGRPGHRVQRAGHTCDRDELGRQRARPGQPSEPHDRTCTPAGRPQLRWRSPR